MPTKQQYFEYFVGEDINMDFDKYFDYECVFNGIPT